MHSAGRLRFHEGRSRSFANSAIPKRANLTLDKPRLGLLGHRLFTSTMFALPVDRTCSSMVNVLLPIICAPPEPLDLLNRSRISPSVSIEMEVQRLK